MVSPSVYRQHVLWPHVRQRQQPSAWMNENVPQDGHRSALIPSDCTCCSGSKCSSWPGLPLVAERFSADGSAAGAISSPAVDPGVGSALDAPACPAPICPAPVRACSALVCKYRSSALAMASGRDRTLL